MENTHVVNTHGLTFLQLGVLLYWHWMPILLSPKGLEAVTLAELLGNVCRTHIVWDSLKGGGNNPKSKTHATGLMMISVL